MKIYNIIKFIFNPQGEIIENRYKNLLFFAVRFITIFCLIYLVWLFAWKFYFISTMELFKNVYPATNKSISNFSYSTEKNQLVIRYSNIPDNRTSRILIRDYRKLHLNQVLIIALFLAVSGFTLRRKLRNVIFGFIILFIIHLFYISQIIEKQNLMFSQRKAFESFLNFYDVFGFYLIPLLIWGIIIYLQKKKSGFSRTK